MKNILIKINIFIKFMDVDNKQIYWKLPIIVDLVKLN